MSASEVLGPLYGSFIFGRFEGVNEVGGYARIAVRVGPDPEKSFVELLEFRPYDSVTGEATVESGLSFGDMVQCEVRYSSQLYGEKINGVPTGVTKSFIKKQAVSVRRQAVGAKV